MPNEFCDHIIDLLREWGAVKAKAMFGGYGLYRQGIIFAIVVDEMLYLKVDGQNRPELEKRGSEPFTYEAKGKHVALSYWQVPTDALEDQELLTMLAEQALQAALRAKLKKTAPKRVIKA